MKYTVEGGKPGVIDIVTQKGDDVFMYEAKTSTIPGKVAPLTPNQATNYPLINDGANVNRYTYSSKSFKTYHKYESGSKRDVLESL